MRFREIKGGMRIPISIEEETLVTLIEKSENKFVYRKDLDERQAELARKLVSRGMLDRFEVDEEICYGINDLDDIWYF